MPFHATIKSITSSRVLYFSLGEYFKILELLTFRIFTPTSDQLSAFSIATLSVTILSTPINFLFCRIIHNLIVYLIRPKISSIYKPYYLLYIIHKRCCVPRNSFLLSYQSFSTRFVSFKMYHFNVIVK